MDWVERPAVKSYTLQGRSPQIKKLRAVLARLNLRRIRNLIQHAYYCTHKLFDSLCGRRRDSVKRSAVAFGATFQTLQPFRLIQRVQFRGDDRLRARCKPRIVSAKLSIDRL